MSKEPSPKVVSTQLKTAFGEFQFYCFAWGSHEEDNLLCLATEGLSACLPLCRVQSACYTAEIFRSLDCDCHKQLTISLSRIHDEGGIFIYMLCDGRGAGLFTKTLGLKLGLTEGLDTSDAYIRLGVEQDLREYSRVAYVLEYFKVKKVRLLTNNPKKVEGLTRNGIEVMREGLEVPATPDSAAYLRAKAEKMGHLLSQFSRKE